MKNCCSNFRLSYSIGALIASLLLITPAFELRGQDVSAKRETAPEAKFELPIKPKSKPEVPAVYLELMSLVLPKEKPAQPSEPSPSVSSQTAEVQPTEVQPAESVENADAPKVKVRPSNHMLSLIVTKSQTKKKNKPKTNSKKKTSQKKTGQRKAPTNQVANGSFNACLQAIAPYDVAYTRISDIRGKGGCKLTNGLKVTRIQGVAIKPAAKLNCDMVVRTARMLDRAQSSAANYFAARIESLHHMSAYSCRRRPSGKISEHGFGNALDVGSIRLSNGIKTSVLGDWYSDGTSQGNALSRLWYEIAGHGCDAYRLVLSPVSNAAHKNHLHFDAGRWTLCER